VVGCGGIEVFVSQSAFADADNKYERIEKIDIQLLNEVSEKANRG